MASQVSSEAAQAQVADAETLSDDTVVIVGGGPVGLTLATVLAYYGVKSVLFERNQTTTRWPKMDLTNARSMEIFRRLGLADSLRAQGVPSHYPYRVIVSTGLSRDMPITQWDHPSVDKYRENIQKQNDGTMPLEPYQRLSQALFEAWLKKIDDANPLIDLRYGWKVEKVEANGEDVKTVAVNVNSGKRCSLISNYVAGCDGASSKVRTGLGIPLDGGPTPGFVLLVHFISKDLARLRKQGQFWHNFLIAPPGTIGGAIIAQDEVDTWTTHLFLPLDADESKISSEEAVYRVLGGMGEDYEITIDEVLVRSTYRPNIAVARTYSALNGRVFLAGDAAHQNIPTGGYGMNMGIADAYDLGWKLAAVVSGHGEKGLLQCYEMERRPVAFTSVERSKVHIGTHAAIGEILQSDPTAIDADTEQGRLMRQRIHDHYQTHDGENKDLGVEMDFHYKSPVNISDESLGAELLGPPEPEWDPRRYVPSTFPGHRAPHVFLSDGTAIFDHYGKDYTLVEFSDGSDRGASRLVEAAKEASFPLKHTRLVDEEHAYKIWDQKRLVLVRPDGHVSWRSDHLQDAALAKRIVQTVAGVHIQMEADDRKAFTISGSDVMSSQTTGFTLEKMGDLQA